MELLEREADLEALRRSLRLAETGEGQFVFVGAEAGGGKTSLVRRFARETGARARVINVSCDGLSTPEPLGPLLDAAPLLGLSVEQLLREGASRDRVYRAVLVALDPATTTIIIAENAHWSDEASLGLLRFLARHLDDRRLLVVVTYRDD
jgi:predicted ATPase